MGPDLDLLAFHAAKPVHGHWVMVKERTAFIAEYGGRRWGGSIPKTRTPDGFQRRVFKGTIWGEGCRGHDFFLIGW